MASCLYSACLYRWASPFRSFLVPSCGLSFSACRSPSSIFCRAGLVALNPLSSCLSVKLWRLHHVWASLAGQSFLCRSLFPFITLNVSCPTPCWPVVSAEKSANSPRSSVVRYLSLFSCCFSYSLLIPRVFVTLIAVCLGVLLSGLTLHGVSVPPALGDCFPPRASPLLVPPCFLLVSSWNGHLEHCRDVY